MPRPAIRVLVPLLSLSLLAGCAEERALGGTVVPVAIAGVATQSVVPRLDHAAIALTPHRGDTPLDGRIRAEQQEVGKHTGRLRAAHLERLGVLFLEKARKSFDPGFYKLAEECALAVEQDQPAHSGALLLRGHVRHSLHDFRGAERIARQLLPQRTDHLVFGLLGDTLLDQGRLAEARDAYQKMLDRKPCLESYTRAARIRFLRGDPNDARRLLRMARAAGSVRNPEPLAWTHTRLAELEFFAGNKDEALAGCRAALGLIADYAPALLVQGRVYLHGRQLDAAIEVLRRAATCNPLPEYRWALIEALELAGRSAEAAVVQTALLHTGDRDDPRTFALYLLNRRRDPARALRLAEAELLRRQDVFTHGLHAFALLANKRVTEAAQAMAKAVAHGTRDARLCYQQGCIAAAAGDPSAAREAFRRATELQHMLLPSEALDLQHRIRALR
ncbi:MAG: tetratricopeptide repeat protein [Planctomycetes bacterium]|nr:tetratricopeptide repeat protein [Planctomycetota bacterium]MCB9889448.1 tetratricopeptide repeat protein [Planctomycetota bacterium]